MSTQRPPVNVSDAKETVSCLALWIFIVFIAPSFDEVLVWGCGRLWWHWEAPILGKQVASPAIACFRGKHGSKASLSRATSRQLRQGENQAMELRGQQMKTACWELRPTCRCPCHGSHNIPRGPRS